MMGIARTSISGMRVWGRARWGFSGRPVSDFPPTADAGRGYALREVPPSKERVMIPEGRQSFDLMSPTQARIAPLRDEIHRAIDDLLASFPDPDRLSFDERRGIIARYTAVLEGNFIYWMTAAYLSCVSAEAHAIIHANLLEEVRDNHPGMLRRFTTAAHAVPTDSDALAVYRSLQSVRLFVGRLSGVKIDRKSTRLNSSHLVISYAVFCLKKKKTPSISTMTLRISRPSLTISRSPASPQRNTPTPSMMKVKQ